MDRENQKRKADVLLLQGATLIASAEINGRKVDAIIDTGATMSVISKNCVHQGAIVRTMSIPVTVGSGQTIFTLGEAEMVLKLGEKAIPLKAQVLDTDAFQAVLGMDFLQGPRCTGIITFPSPPKLMLDGELYPLMEHKSQKGVFSHVFRIFKKESYTLIHDVKSKALTDLAISRNDVSFDLFANHFNFQEEMYCTRQNSSFYYNWSSLCSKGEILWANPPFSQLEKVLTKVCLEPCKIILVCPNWEGTPWSKILDMIVTKCVQIPQGKPLYE